MAACKSTMSRSKALYALETETILVFGLWIGARKSADEKCRFSSRPYSRCMPLNRAYVIDDELAALGSAAWTAIRTNRKSQKSTTARRVRAEPFTKLEGRVAQL